MNDTSAAYLNQARLLTAATLRGLPVKVFLFGSRASGTAGRCSDIDIALLPADVLPTSVVKELRERLEESHIPYRVDVVDLTLAEPALRQRVLTEGVPWSD